MTLTTILDYRFITMVLTAMLVTGFGWWSESPKTNKERMQKAQQMYQEYRESFPEVPDIAAEAVLKRMDTERFLFIDVRDAKEQAVSMIPGAITAKEFLKSPDSYKDRTLVAYCTIGYRSGKLAREMATKGIRILNLKCGIIGWTHAGGQVVHNGQVVHQVHVYGRKWDLIPLGYQAIY